MSGVGALILLTGFLIAVKAKRTFQAGEAAGEADAELWLRRRDEP